MELTAEEVDKIEEVRLIVEDLIDMADDSEVLNEENLRLLEAQLDALHQALSMAVAHKERINTEDL